MLAGTLVTVIGFLPVGFARSTAGEYAGNIFWIVGFSLIASWIVAVVFTPYLGVKLLPEVKTVKGGHAGIYSTPGYQRIRQLVTWCVRKKYTVAGIVVGAFLMAGGGMAVVKKQFFPNSDRPELLVEVQLPLGTSIETTSAAAKKIEHWLSEQPESKIVTSYIGAGAPRFFFSYNPELPDPSFAKIVVLTPNAEARDHLKLRLRQAAADGLAPEARIRATQLVFGPYSPFPVAFRVMGPDPAKVREIARSVEEIMRNDPNMRTVNVDWGERVPKLHFVLDQERLQLIGLSPEEAAQQLQFLLNGQTITQVRENIRAVNVVVRSAGPERLDPTKLENFTLTTRNGKPIPLSQIGRVEIQPEDPLVKRRDRVPTITVRGDNIEIDSTAGCLFPDLGQTCSASKGAAGKLSHRDGGLDRGSKESQLSTGSTFPHHAPAHAGRHHHSGALFLGHVDGDADRPARTDRRSAGAAHFSAAFWI